MTRILYVEDNDDNVYMLRGRLTRAGFEVVVATDGAKGVAMAAAEVPDLIVMDLSLPVLDGWEASRRLKEAPDTRPIPIIALSDDPRALRRMALHYGVVPQELHPPSDMTGLVRQADQLVQQRGYAASGDLWTPGYFRANLDRDQPAALLMLDRELGSRGASG